MTDEPQQDAGIAEPEPQSAAQPAAQSAAQNSDAAQNTDAAQPPVEELMAQLGVEQPGAAQPGFGQPGVEQLGAEQPAEPGKPKRRIRSGTLFTAALIVGVLGGVGTGYAVQSSRPPTPLPPLTVTQPRYVPAGVYQGIAPAQLPGSQDDAAITESDLTALLVPVPAGASTGDAGWLDQMIDEVQTADLCDDPVSCFGVDLRQGVLAAADTGWTTSQGYDVEIRIFRMAPGFSSTAREWAGYGENGGSTSTQIPMPTDLDAHGYEFLDSNDDNDDFAEAAHGDIAMEFWVTSHTQMPDTSVIDSIITQQMGRL
jgi:hypothetical protein